LPESGFVFCCFNTTYKLLPDVWALWMRLLRDTADGVLWLAPGDPAASDNLRATALALGVDPARLIFAPRVAPQSYLARLRCADLFLDTFPYNAGVTCNDALLVGLPVLTCAGETYASRIAGSQLHAIGLPELVTHSLADYEATALRLAREPGLLTGLRMRLGANRHTHCLFDMAQFTREFEDALELAWEQLATGVTGR
jgi:predicted O-linked N-acetylglucosamine transferase (SPINDLY family)